MLNRLSTTALLVWVFGAAAPAGAAPKAELWERWTAHDTAASASIDHQAWSRFLAKHVQPSDSGVNRIPYGEVSDRDRQTLDDYLLQLTRLSISRYNRHEQLAYWINLYNALTIAVVLEHYPVKSILDISISPGLFKVGPWDKKLIEVEGEMLSLNDIEHRILRPIWSDPRVHYAVNCASIGCPNLRPRAFTAEDLDDTLDRAARDYINSDRGVVYQDGDLYVSSIFDWFQEDFGDNDQEVIQHLRQFADPTLEARLAKTARIRDDFYNWELNDLMVGEVVVKSRKKKRQGSSTK